MKFITPSLALVLSLVLASCNNTSNKPGVGEYDAEHDIISFAQQDSMMNAATEMANATFPMFMLAFKNPTPQMSQFYVKMAFDYDVDGSTEHIWFAEPHYRSDSALYAIVSNEVAHIDGLEFGDTMPVNMAQLSDWMYVENDTLRGGYTTRVIWANMTEDEKADLVKQLGYKIE